MKKLIATMLLVVACSQAPDPRGNYPVTEQEYERVSSALTCHAWAGTICVLQCPSPLPGWADCFGDTAARVNELVWTTGANATGCCQYTYGTPTHSSIGEWNDVIGHVQNKQARTYYHYLHNNYGGTIWQTPVGTNSNTPFGVSSINHN